jgi:threonine dehydrogenase-like Zn-dependent dehydrogenase
VSALRDALAGRPDIVFDCVASQASTHQSIRLAKKGGRIVVVGVAAGDVRVPLHIIQDREICIEGSAMYVKQDVLQAIEFMRDRKVHTLELVTAMLPLAEAREAFALARSGDSVKVHVATSF